jgi:hypothetical protein
MLNPSCQQQQEESRVSQESRVKTQDSRDKRQKTGKDRQLETGQYFQKKRYKKPATASLRDARRNISVTETIFQLEGVISGTESLKQRGGQAKHYRSSHV